MYKVDRSDLEVRVLGAIVTDPKQFFEISTAVNPEMFTSWRKDAAKHLWLRMEQLNPFDVHTIKDALPTKHKQWAYDLYSIITRNGAEFAFDLQQVYYRQEETNSLLKAVSELQKGDLPYSEVIRRIESERQLRNSLVSVLEKDLDKYVDLAHRVRKPSTVKKGVSTGFKTMDDLFGGWNPGDYNVFAARPGMGKTTLLLNFILGALKSGSKPVLYSFEMTWEQLVERFACIMAGINPDDLIKFNEGGPEREKVALLIEQLADLPVFVYDSTQVSKNIEDVCLHIRQLQQKEGIDVVFMDYLQLMSSYKDGKQYKEYESVTNVSNAIASLSKAIKMPFTVLAQLNRSVEMRGGSKRPQMSDLRGSGQVEQDATGLFFIYRPEYYQILEDEEGQSLKGITEIIINKHRLAGSRVSNKVVKLLFNVQTGNFTDEIKDDYFDYTPEVDKILPIEASWSRITTTTETNENEVLPW